MGKIRIMDMSIIWIHPVQGIKLFNNKLGSELLVVGQTQRQSLSNSHWHCRLFCCYHWGSRSWLCCCSGNQDAVGDVIIRMRGRRWGPGCVWCTLLGCRPVGSCRRISGHEWQAWKSKKKIIFYIYAIVSCLVNNRLELTCK